MYPQFDSGGLEDVAAIEGFSDSLRGSKGSGGFGRGQNPGGLVVISSVGPDSSAAAAAAAAEAEAGSSSSSRQSSFEIPSSSSDSGSSSVAASSDSNSNPHMNGMSQLVTAQSSSSSRSSLELMSGGLSSVCAGLVCKRIAGLALGGQIAAGSYGRVYRGDYFGSKVREEELLAIRALLELQESLVAHALLQHK
jgi:hypothetical protein